MVRWSIGQYQLQDFLISSLLLEIEDLVYNVYATAVELCLYLYCMYINEALYARQLYVGRVLSRHFSKERSAARRLDDHSSTRQQSA